LEACEGRDCPSVSAVINGGVLTVQGDGGNDTVQITFDNGQYTATISGSSGSSTATGPVAAITVLTKGGNDSVVFNAVDPLTSNLALTVDLGVGSDNAAVTNHLDVNLNTGIANAALSLVVTGGAGIDQGQVSLGDLDNANVAVTATLTGGADVFNTDLNGAVHNTSQVALVDVGGNGNDALSVGKNGNNFTIDSGSRVSATLSGGAGNDTLSLASNGNVAGTLQATLLGGVGNDTVSSVVNNAGGTGRVAINEQGGNGNDTFTLTVKSSGPVDAVIIGGAGSDTATATNNVSVTGVEHLSTVTVTL
jgi:hypothetical protein